MNTLPSEKDRLRQSILCLRRDLPDREERSQRCMQRLQRTKWFKDATSVLWYIDLRSEVQTRRLVQIELDDRRRRCIVPFCDGPVLTLVELRKWSELATGSFGILEPHQSVREDRERRVSIGAIDLALIPGVAFDRLGNRIGYGKGFYDRLLAPLRSRPALVGLAFDCQVLDSVNNQPHDVPMNQIVTESEVIECTSPHGVRAPRDPC